MEKEIIIRGCKINYDETGLGKTIIMLHGWGCDHSIFITLQNYLKARFRILSIDLPGFGKSETPVAVLGIEDYADIITEFIEKLNIKNPVLIGHSFGGRVAIILGARKKTEKLILIDSAGIKPKRKISYYLRVYLYKLLKNIGKIKVLTFFVDKMKDNLGSKDYKSASGIMRQILVKVVNSDLREYLPEILSPTLLLWGNKDTVTPVEDAYILGKLIKDAGVVVFENCGHYSFLEKPMETNIIIENFLLGEANEHS